MLDILDQAIEHLSQDPIMAQVIKSNPVPTWSTDNDLFLDLVDAIISQQLSVKAGNTILKRFTSLFPDNKPQPDLILKLTDEAIRACGLSNAKVTYVKSLATEVLNKTIDLTTLDQKDDEEVITELTKVKGIGRWTAEMILIFSLHRPDIFSLGDLGLCTAVAKLYNVKRDNKKKIEKISRKWSPYRSIASRYLWMSLNNTPTI